MSRRWFRSSCAETLVLTCVGGLLVVTCSHALAAENTGYPAVVDESPAGGAKTSSARLPELLRKVQDKYRKAPSLMAVFQQVNESAVLKTRKQSEGVISILKPDRVRWETQKPDPSIFISDGKTMWFYTPPFETGENGQLVIRKASQYQSKLASALLSGNFEQGKDLKVTAKGRDLFALTPRLGTAGDVVTAELHVDPNQLLIDQVTLKHKDGNVSQIKLSKITLGDKVGEDMFRFTPPPKTDVIKE